MISTESARAQLAERRDLNEQPIHGLSVKWSVDYLQNAHDMRLAADVRADSRSDITILQVWLTNVWIGGVAIIEDIPQVTSVVEFERDANVKYVKVGLFDGKWRREDNGQRYRAILNGYCRVNADVRPFSYIKEYDFPGW